MELLRAQTFEIYLAALMLAFFYHFASAMESSNRSKIQCVLAAVCLGGLCLCKAVYLVLLPPVFACLPFNKRRSMVSWFWIPILAFVCLLFVANWYRFGSPFNLGYSQWKQEAHPFTANLFPGLQGLLFSKQGSVFLYFPVLIFASLGWPAFFNKHRRDAILIATFALLLLLVTAAFRNWKGESCYGPRYLLPVLPLLALPFVNVAEMIGRTKSAAVKWLASAAIAVVIGYSMVLQIAVNSSPFFFWYDLAAIVNTNGDGAAAHYLNSHHFGTVDLDFLQYAAGHRSRFQRDFVSNLDSTEFVSLEGLKSETALNYYWWHKPVEALP